jgi:hypothetical protein
MNAEGRWDPAPNFGAAQCHAIDPEAGRCQLTTHPDNIHLAVVDGAILSFGAGEVVRHPLSFPSQEILGRPWVPGLQPERGPVTAKHRADWASTSARMTAMIAPVEAAPSPPEPSGPVATQPTRITRFRRRR